MPLAKVLTYPGLDDDRAVQRKRQLAERLRQHELRETAGKPMAKDEKQAFAKAGYDKLVNMRFGGT